MRALGYFLGVPAVDGAGTFAWPACCAWVLQLWKLCCAAYHRPLPAQQSLLTAAHSCSLTDSCHSCSHAATPPTAAPPCLTQQAGMRRRASSGTRLCPAARWGGKEGAAHCKAHCSPHSLAAVAHIPLPALACKPGREGRGMCRWLAASEAPSCARLGPLPAALAPELCAAGQLMPPLHRTCAGEQGQAVGHQPSGRGPARCVGGPQ